MEASVEQNSERKLLCRIRQGDRDAYEELVRTHHPRVYALLAHLSRDLHLAEDLTQETFVSAWSSIGRFAGRSSLITWLSRIAHRKFLDARRRGLVEEKRTRDFHEQYAAQLIDHTASADPSNAEHRRRLYEALGEMQEDERTILTLHYLQGLSYREMASVLDKPTGTVKWQTRQALQQLRTRLNGRLES